MNGAFFPNTGLALLATIWNLACSAQGRETPLFESPRITPVLWKDTVLVMDNSDYQLFDVDSVRDVRTDTGLVRLEWKDGELLRLALVIQQPRTDTVYFDRLDGSGYDMQVNQGVGDIAHGTYKELCHPGLDYWRTGTMRLGLPVGEWHYVANQSQVRKIIRLNEHGWPEGPSTEYHPNGQLSWIGNYGTRKYSWHLCRGCTEPSSVTETVPTGIWKHYDDQGRLIQVVEYTWIE